MTYKERLQQEHPEMNDADFENEVLFNCPSTFGYEENWYCLGDIDMSCDKCWDRKMEES